MMVHERTRTRQRTPEQRRRQAIITVAALVVIGLVFGAAWLVDHHSSPASSASASAISTPHRATKSSLSASVPAHVRATLTLIDSGDWPAAAHAPGTHGGDVFRNNGRQLPVTDSSGTRITYREWDVNPKQRGHGRDAERIVTGSDGSAWYTADHYRTFTVIRRAQ